MMNRKGFLSTGMWVRLVAAVIDVVSLPFLILSPNNIFAIVAFGFGNFLLIIGGVMD